MKEYLFIRFFVNKESGIPYSSNRICRSDQITEDVQKKLGVDMMKWMWKHPNGKVDFVWATVVGIM